MVTRRPRARPSASQVPSGTPTTVGDGGGAPGHEGRPGTTSSTGSDISGAVPVRASGKNSGCPYCATPKRPISRCVAAEVTHPANSRAQPTLVPGWRTTMTW